MKNVMKVKACVECGVAPAGHGALPGLPASELWCVPCDRRRVARITAALELLAGDDDDDELVAVLASDGEEVLEP